MRDPKTAWERMQAREIIRAVLKSDFVHYACEGLLSFALWIVTSKLLFLGIGIFFLVAGVLSFILKAGWSSRL